MVETFFLVFFMGIMNFSLKVFHPLVIGLGLLLILVLTVGFVAFYGALYSFCLFMVMVGGVLVVFSYTISLIPFSFEKVSFEKMVFGSSEDSKLSMLFGALLSFGGFLFLFIISFFSSEMSEFGFFSSIMYFSEDWSICIVWISVLLFLIMIFSVSVASNYNGALLK